MQKMFNITEPEGYKLKQESIRLALRSCARFIWLSGPRQSGTYIKAVHGPIGIERPSHKRKRLKREKEAAIAHKNEHFLSNQLKQ